MEDFVFLFAFIIFILFFVVAVVSSISKFRKVGGSEKKTQQSRSFNREVDSIHITSDAITERRRRLDQLKSLYEAGMMEKDEYYERCESVEADYNRTRY